MVTFEVCPYTEGFQHSSFKAVYTVVCTALANAHNCIYSNQVRQHYGLQPMSLEQYCAMYV